MELRLLAMLCYCLFVSQVNFVVSKSDNGLLSRRKRYVVFPEGSTMSVAFCMSVNTLTAYPTVFTEGVNWGIAYDLPNDTSSTEALFGSKHVHNRRRRRDLYEKMESVMDLMGYDGRACIFRTLCETEQKILPNGENIIEELLRIVFRFPLQRVYNSEPEIHRSYHWARSMGREKHNCERLFPSCHVSLLDIVLNLKHDNSLF